METTFQAVDAIYKALNDGGFESLITGQLYKGERPTGSEKEDVVINCLPMSNDQVQLATVNVNIYTPDLEMKIDGVPQFIANDRRLKSLCESAISLLEFVADDLHDFYVVSQSVVPEESIHQHFVNLRLEYKFYNLQNT